ncbi:putative retrotransposon hot spot (RHS) protein [Trypanosoma cruzi]|uniref:Retrotransposon hot spot (RHS) protein, putative n=2 Tax=Trypanosoma cruzi TaxID=5693 RepID=Q4CU66_TRYCC|nr:retrotransposon hot spot (RHS) protein, putative [Trypanosoma cruzi]EAN83818.1 retrotransposon hot spot (RHS) protein, putative [Trypanosoma cruzi]PWV20352.1 putative retrotransposon hot spot (RHS) protein [Trypanosoma cruzi]RNC52576.1 putative retrotransposon hot spot (RHS) protein [Trypanosoma cruzi]|eukprot:XP_805669.1 retrotransposon hot spot (RHS) protein [Trypanosoma cruzi strain CL Brener]
MWRCCGRLHVALLRRRWALTVSPTGVAVRLHGAPTTEPCERHAQRHWDCEKKQPRVPIGASGTCWPQLGGASGMLHHTGVVMAPRSGIPGDGSDAATRRGVEETRQPKWTMSSSVEDILLGGDTSTDMKLNDFLRNYVGGRAAVDEDHNVTMQVFVQEPDAYVQDQRLFRIIFNLTEYQEMKRELDEMKILLEDITKLHHESVFSIEQWRDYEGKDTVTSLARGKLNAALTQVLREERRVAEERLIRAQEMKFTFSTTIEEVLFKGGVRVKEMKLNDFLTMELDGRGVVDTNRDVLLEEFFKDPKKYIPDKGVLKEMQITDAYARMERAVRDEMDMEEDIKKLYKNGVYDLLKWSEAAAEVKATVHGITNEFLDVAFEEARILTTTSAVMKLEGLYESVYNARWSHVVEVPHDKGMGMEVKKGKPEQSWTYREVGDTLERNDAVQQSGAATPVLMVLTSDDGWPYTLNAPHGSGNDFFINCEVERVWQIVKRDLTEWFSNFDLTLNPSPMPRVLIGTPGIGNSAAAGSYLLYQLLHCDVEKLQVVVHCFGDTAYVFHKITKTVTKYTGNKTSKIVVDGLWQRGMKGYIIYDVAKKGTPPDTDFAPCNGWGMIVVSSPEVSNYDKWATQVKATQIIMNCPDEMDVKAMCAWVKRGVKPDKQAEYWRMVEKHMKKVGPIPRHIFDADEYGKRTQDVMRTLEWINIGGQGRYFALGGSNLWYSEDPSHKLVKIVRVRGKSAFEGLSNAPICNYLGVLTVSRLAKIMSLNDFLFLVLGMKNVLQPAALKKYALNVLLSVKFVTSIVKDLKELQPPSPSEPRSSVLTLNPHGYPTEAAAITELKFIDRPQELNYRVLYIPTFPTFPLVDGFFFVDSPRKTLVGLQMTTASAHHTTTSTVKQFTECLASYFDDWDELSRDMSWEMIYVQHENSTMITKRQKCDVVIPNNLSDAEKEIVAFWDGKVHQYQFVLTPDFVNKIREKCEYNNLVENG